MKWTRDKLELIKEYLKQGLTYRQIATNTNLTYDQIGHAVQRYKLKEDLDMSAIFKKERGKLKKDDIEKLAKLLGEHLYDSYKKVDLPIYKPVKSRKKREEMSILDLSDIHIGMKNYVFDSGKGKKVLTYDMNIFEKELGVLQDSIGQIHSILSDSYNLKEITVFMLGDIITNDRIFPEQAFEIEKVVGLQIWDAVNYLIKFFNNLLAIYEKITIVGVVGNHGRSNPTHYEEPVENNFEYWVYKMIQKQFADNPRINVIVPTTRRYIHKIYGWTHLLEHGDSMRGSSETYIEKQIKELSLNIGGFDVMHFGHFHKLKEREIADKVIVKQNGSWILKDGYAFKKFKTYSVPKQWFFGCSPKRVETWNYKIDLRG
jgi:hypothetical protein